MMHITLITISDPPGYAAYNAIPMQDERTGTGMWNYSLNEKIERGLGYGQSEVELRYALRARHNLVMLKVATYAESLWGFLVSMFFWSPLFWFMFLVPAYMFLFVLLKNLMAIPVSGSTGYSFLLAYATAMYLSLREQSPLRDYRARNQHVGTKTLTLDFSKQLLIAEEVYRFAPQKNRVQTAAFDKIYAHIIWHKGDRDTGESIFVDSASVYLRLKSGGFKHMPWANKKIAEYIFTHEYDSTDAAQTSEAKEKVDGIIALLKSQNLHQK